MTPRKKVQSCTKHPLFNCISYVLLSLLYKAFVSLLYIFLCIPKNWMEVVENTMLKKAMVDEIRSLLKK